LATSNPKHEFLPRSHPAKYGRLDKSNWKDLRVRRSWKLIDPAIRELIRVLNARGFKTFSSCSGGHRRNLHYRDIEHEGGYICFFPPSRLAFKWYFDLRSKQKAFEFHVRVTTMEERNLKRLESTQFEWQLGYGEISKRDLYRKLFDDMASIANELKPSSSELQFSELSKQYGSSMSVLKP
jgi:hypothetical protein